MEQNKCTFSQLLNIATKFLPLILCIGVAYSEFVSNNGRTGEKVDNLSIQQAEDKKEFKESIKEINTKNELFQCQVITKMEQIQSDLAVIKYRINNFSDTFAIHRINNYQKYSELASPEDQ